MEKEWPIVLPNDSGIRPAGKPFECFYCYAKIGQLHSQDCVMVEKLVEYEVLDLEGDRVGLCTRTEPHYWNNEMMEFHKNQSTWCVVNADIVFDATPAAHEMEKKISQLTREQCPCGLMVFKVNRIIDPGPLRGG